MRYALKKKDKYDARKAKAERLNVRAAVALMLEGPAQGEKRKVDYKAREVWPCNSPTQKANRRRRFVSLLFMSAEPVAAAPVLPTRASPSVSDEKLNVDAWHFGNDGLRRPVMQPA